MKDKHFARAVSWPTPTTPKELSSALGFFSFYAPFIPRFAHLTAELNSHKRKRKLEWTPELDKDFEELKAAFKRSTLRHHLVTDKDHRLPGIELSIDFSSKAVAAVISQNTDGHPRFIAAAGRKLKDYESRYHSSKGELLALHFALTQFSHLLTSSKFKVFTDSTLSLIHI